MIKKEKITGRILCRKVFETTKKWITAQELCDIAEEKGYFKLYNSNAIDETAAIKALLYVEAKKEDGEFISNDSFPVKFQFRERYIEKDKLTKLNIKSSIETGSKFLQLAVKVLKEEERPLTASDICDIAVDKGYDKYLESTGKTPRATLSSMLSTNSKKEDGIFTSSDSRPTQYSLRSWKESNVSSTPSKLKPNNKTDNNYISKMIKGKRKPVDAAMRMYIWRRFWGSNMDGQCLVCGIKTIVEDFEAGHIESVANNGGDDITNFAPICGGCNSGMRTENMKDYKKRVYPHVHVKSLVNLFP